jgi:Na+/H+ antiporter NhaC
MNNLKLISALFLMAMSFMSYGQKTGGTQSTSTKVIAVVNRANWCGVCKANGERLSNNITPYATKGLAIVMNDLTDETTIAKSKADLKKSSLYKAIYKTNRKGVGRMMQACGIIHGKDKTMASGIVTFIDAKTLKVLSETSIAITDAEMKKIIDNLLKS